MSDTTTQVNIRLEAEDRAAEVIRSLKRDVDALSRSLRNLTQIRMPAFASGSPLGSPGQAADALRVNAQVLAATKVQAASERQAARQRAADARTENRQRKVMKATALRDLRAREAANARAARQQLAGIRAVEQEERRAAAETERRSNAVRSQHARDTRFLFGLRQRHDRDQRREHDRDQRDMRRHGREARSRGSDAYHDTTRPVGMAALAGTAATGAAARRILGAESDADAAEINTRIFGGLSKDAARQLRDLWAAPLAEELGASTAKMLSGYTEALKVGIPDQGAKAFAGLSIKTSEAWGVGLDKVVDTLGIANTILTSGGKSFDFDRLQSVANAISHLSAKMATTPEKMLSFMERGAGAAQLLGMSQESGLAFGAASTSLGNQAGESGRLFDYLASRIVEMPRLVKKDGDDGDQARALMRDLGYGSATEMERQRRANPDEFLFDFIERFGRIKNDRKREQSIRYLSGREWLGELSRIVKGPDTLKDAQRFAKESKALDAIGAVWALHRTKLAFTFKQFKAGWLGIMGEIGKELSPLARQIGDYFLGWSAKLRNGGLQARVKAALEGFVVGLGFRDMPALLKGIFGEPGQGAAGSIQAWRDAARGFGEGLRDVGNAVRSFFTLFTGQNASPETIGRWTARILGFGAALIVLSPILTVLSGLTSGILALGAAATTALAAFKLAGLVSASGAAAGAAAGAGGLAALLGAAVLPVSLVAISAGVVAALWGREAVKGLFLGVPSGNGGTPKTLEGDLGAELGAIAPRGQAKVEKQSWNGAFDDRPMVTKASLITTELAAGLDRLGRALGATGARVQFANLGASSSTALGNFVGGGSSGGGVPGFSGSSAPTVPGWFGRGGMGGAVGPANSRNYTFGNGLFDAIIKAEGTAKKGNPYDEVLGYGQYGRPDKRLSTMTLAEVHAHGLKMRAAQAARGTPWNRTSSASGAFQIVGSTMKDAARALGMDWNTTVFDEATQKKMAAWIAKKQGLGAWEGFKHHPGELAKAGQAMQNGNLEGSQPGKATTSPTTPGAPTGAAANPSALVGGVHPLDGKGRLTSDFGMRRHPISGMLKFHRGLDLAAPGDTAVKAMRDGTVAIDRSGDVTVKHPDGSSTTYRHVNAGVEAGQKVAAGQHIATLRQNDPRSTGPHLHLEGRDARGALIDPKGLLMPKGKEAVPEGMKPFTSSGWKPKAPGTDAATADPGFSSAGWKPTSAVDAIKKVPLPEPRSAVGSGQGERAGMGLAGGSGSRGGSTISVVNHIQAGHQSPAEMAAHIQRHVTEAWHYRAHDLEPELT